MGNNVIVEFILNYLDPSIPTIFGLIIFWTVLFSIFTNDPGSAVLPVLFMVVISGASIKKLGLTPTIIIVVVILVVGGFLVVVGSSKTPTLSRSTQTTTTPTVAPSTLYNNTQPITVSPSIFYHNIPPIIVLPSTLYHGTPTLTAARDIYWNNRWRIKNHQPHGIYFSENFDEAATYAGTAGAIVMANVSLPNSTVVDDASCPGNNDQALAMGYRLVKKNTIYIALVPENVASGTYYRVTGITPVRLLDSLKQPINTKI